MLLLLPVDLRGALPEHVAWDKTPDAAEVLL
jgi:hypothetical protein